MTGPLREGKGQAAESLTNICDVRMKGRRAKSNAAKNSIIQRVRGCFHAGLPALTFASPSRLNSFSTDHDQNGAPCVRSRRFTYSPARPAAAVKLSGVKITQCRGQ